ncbi:M64 family metallopeptidase [Roseburia sp. AM23-20]|uniref:M64 family metallopeptidase n=1 Tax=Roseburia sp. AM23-20 TaxID=2292066 RepID=UPI001FA94F7D|nr:M64 family metallopeptidase [Roseburia sp. AM23-20]
MKRKTKRIQAVCIYMMLLLLLLLPQTVMAKNTEKSKTTFPVQVIHKTGDDKENFVIVIMGDGYTAGQQDQFLEDATQKARGMLTWSPYREYSDRINIYAVQAVSNESGIGVYGGKSPDTYFHVKVYGKAAGFTNGGDERAKALRTELEENYLDEGANVGTIHILCNDTGSYGASVNPLFSFSTNSEDNSDGMVMAHETAHSIGGLGDEYERYTNKPNMSDTTDPEKIKWSKMLGFRGIGITNAGTDTAFAPSRECMMRWLGQPFCEVCKMELARKLNNTDYVSKPAALYISDPEVSIPHNKTATLDRDSEKYRITESNITKANDHDLEFRTVVQNMVNKEQHLKMSFRIIGADGITVKYSAEKEFTIQALTNFYDPDAARESLSVVLNDVYGLTNGDRLDGKIVDMDTQEVLATDKTGNQAWSTVNIHYRLKNEDGTETDIPNTKASIVHVPRNSTYTLRNPELSGYACVGNSVDQDKMTITEDSMDIVYYYQENNDSSGDEDQEIAECTTRPVTVPYDSNRHTFDIRPGEGVNLRYSMKEDGPYTIEELPAYTDAGKYTIYFEASSDSAKSCYGQAFLKITKAVTELKLLATPAGSEGAGSVTLKVIKQGISADEPVDITCNDSSITLVKKENDQWTVSLPNKTKTYLFTARYNGNANYAGSKAACQVTVKEKKSQTGGGTLIPPEKPTPEEPTPEKPAPEEPTPEKPAPEKPTPEKPAPEKPNPGETEVVPNVTPVPELESKTDKTIKNKTVTIKCKSRKGKKQVLKLDKSTINYLIKKEAKALQLEFGNVAVIMDRNALKEIKKQMNSDVYFHVKKLDKRILSSKAGKIVKKRPMYEISVTGAKKKTLGKLKKGKVTVKIHYKISKKEKKKDLFAYTINKKGNVKKISKSYYDSKKQTVNFTTKSFSKFAVGGRL